MEKHEVLMRNEAKGLIVATAVCHGKTIIVTNDMHGLAVSLATDIANGDKDPQAAACALTLMAMAKEMSIMEISLVELLKDKPMR